MMVTMVHTLRVLPCPWCGDKSTSPIPYLDEPGKPWRVACGNVAGVCGARGPFGSTPEEAARRWNTVVQPFWDMLQEKLIADRAEEIRVRKQAKAAARKKKK